MEPPFSRRLLSSPALLLLLSYFVVLLTISTSIPSVSSELLISEQNPLQSSAASRVKRQVFKASLYDFNDPIVQLTMQNFSSVILQSNKAHMVEFYMSWCGHCQKYAPTWAKLAKDVAGWSEIVQVGAVNCALNDTICNQNGITGVPFIKYFPRRSLSYNNSIKIEAYHDADQLRKQLAMTVRMEHQSSPYPDWPNLNAPSLAVLNPAALWLNVPKTVPYIAVIFTPFNSTFGTEMMLDLWKERNWLWAKVESQGSPFAKRLNIMDFPSIRIFSRTVNGPIYSSDLRKLLLSDISKLNPIQPTPAVTNGQLGDASQQTTLGQQYKLQANSGQSTKMPASNFQNVQRVTKVNYMSETDLLISIRYALYSDVSDGLSVLKGPAFTHLFNFVNVLAKFWPITSEAKGSLDYLKMDYPKYLPRSDKARGFFAKLREALRQVPGQTMDVAQWKNLFTAIEMEAGKPFPEGDWVSCKGSLPGKRGYTCGLWSVFHVLTVSTYLTEARATGPRSPEQFNSLEVPQAIQGWVDTFFSCRECAQHFMQMTNFTFPLTQCIRFPSDVVLYIWKAHNRVNARLAGDHTEDPLFPKQPFPPSDLCPSCNTPSNFPNEYKAGSCAGEAGWNTREVMRFLLKYYSQIKPDASSTSS